MSKLVACFRARVAAPQRVTRVLCRPTNAVLNSNPIKIEGGNINVINSATAQTTTVPGVIGLTEQQARATVVAAGLYMAATAYVTATAPRGTVLAQNSPGGTIEPAGSPVQITVSLGRTTAGFR